MDCEGSEPQPPIRGEDTESDSGPRRSTRHQQSVHVKQEPGDDDLPTVQCHGLNENRDRNLNAVSVSVLQEVDTQSVSVRVKQEADLGEEHLATFHSQTEDPDVRDMQGCTQPGLCDAQNSNVRCEDMCLVVQSNQYKFNSKNTTPSKTRKDGIPVSNSTRPFRGSQRNACATATDKRADSSVELRRKAEQFSNNKRDLPAKHQAKMEEFSDESDCEPLPVHFEAKQRSIGDERLYQCGMCHASFNLPSPLHEHVTQHAHSDRCYTCGQCQEAYLHISLLTQHVCRHTFTDGSQPLPHYEDPRSFVCHVCSKVFRRLYELNRHQKIHSGCRPFECDVCHKSFSRGDELSRHLKIHSGERPFPCDECSRAFITRHELSQHKKSHLEDKPFVCPVCSRGFLRADKLFHHQQMHAGDRPFECDVCHKTFITPSELRQHTKIHTGVKPFACELCCKAYLKVNDLKRHMKMHTGQKPFACDVCGKAFHRTDTLSRHRKIHTREERGKRHV